VPARTKKPDPFNRALAAYIEWGPSSAQPIDVRLKRIFPKARPAEIRKLIAELRDIVGAASRAVVDQLESKQTEDVGRSAVERIDPRISPDNAATLYTQARVAAWRDGYS